MVHALPPYCYRCPFGLEYPSCDVRCAHALEELVQTVTNGRMFQYPAFLGTAADNGLDEITFSLHGHTAKLHEGLTRTPGSFDQTVGGIDNMPDLPPTPGT